MINKLSEIEMMVKDAIALVETGMYLADAMTIVKKEWALDARETIKVWKVASATVYG